MSAEERPQAVFVLSTGRCGTMTMAHLIDLSPAVKCYHEPSPRLIIESKGAYEGSPCAGEIFSACRIDLVTEALDQGLIYGECANRSTFFAPHIDRLFRGRVKFIHLIRDLEGFVQSATKRDWYIGNPWDIGRITPREGWRGQTQRQKIEWLWHETNRFIEDYLKSVEPERKLRFDFSDLSSGDMGPIRGLFSLIGVEPPDEQKVRRILKMQLNASLDVSGVSPESPVASPPREDRVPASKPELSHGKVEGRSKPVDFKGDPVDICVITFSSNEANDHYELITRCLESILTHTDPAKFRLHIGCNNLSIRAMAFVDRIVARQGATRYIGLPHRDAKGVTIYPKYPLMCQMYASTRGAWVVWFDDDIYVTEKDWLERLEGTINGHPDADQFGRIANIALPPSVKEEWIDQAPWARPDKIQYAEMPEGKMIVSPFVLGGFYALSRRAIEACHIPDERLLHNFGDWSTGMALLHNGFQIAAFSHGIVFGDAPRRGIHKDEAVASDTRIVLDTREEQGRKVYAWEEEAASGKTAEPSMDSSQQALPAHFSMETLKMNLDALTGLDKEFVARICLPVDGSHIRFLPGGEVRYERHRNLLPFIIPHDQVASTIGCDLPEEILLFGAGLAEQLDYILSLNGRTKITVWERDPWLLRLVLMKRDYTSFIRSGSLRFALCSDLFDLIKMGMGAQVVGHPFLQVLYENEYLLLQQGIGERRAIVCSGGLFVDDVSQTLRAKGFSLYTLDVKGLSIQEIERSVKGFDPRFLFAVNYTPGLAEICHKLGVPLLCWEVDPAADKLKPLRTPSEAAHIFTYRRIHVEDFKAAGFRNVEYLPLASDPERRSPPALSAEDRERYGASLSFVGSSMVSQAVSFRQIFLEQYKAYRGGVPEAVQEGHAVLEQILSIQRKDFSTFRVRELLEQHFSNFMHHLSGSGFAHDPFMLVAEIAAAEKRINYIANLARLGIKVWGDDGWKVTERFGVKVMGKAGHFQEINKIYGASLINLDINRLYQPDIVTMRIFDIMACGGFVLAEYSPALEEIFSVGKQVEAYSTLDELISKATYYLDHRDEAMKIAQGGREAVLRNHTIKVRIEHMLSRANPLGTRKPS